MSFAATLALIAAYERGLPWMTAGADTLAGRPRRAVGRPRDRRADPCVAGRGTGDHALCGLPFSSPRALRRDRQSAGHADRLGLGDADGLARRCSPCRSASTALFWRLMGDGIDWMIAVALCVASLPGAVGRDGGVRRRAAAARHRRAGRAVPAENAAALERRRAGRRRQPVGGPHAAAGCAGLGRRPGARGARRRRPAVGPSHRPRRLRRQGMARRRRRCAAARTTRRLGEGFRCDASGCIAQLARRQAGLAGRRRPMPSRRTARGPRSWSRARERAAGLRGARRSTARCRARSGAIALRTERRGLARSRRRGPPATTGPGRAASRRRPAEVAPPCRGAAASRAMRRRAPRIWKPGD